MPELPEVETVRRGLIPALLGRTLVEVKARRADLRWPLPPHFVQRLKGRRVEGLRRRAKFLIINLDNDEVLLVHLGMSGRMRVSGAEAEEALGRFTHNMPPGEPGLGPHDHIVFETDRGNRIVFTDHRRFGAMDLTPASSLETHKWLRGLGPEPLGGDFDARALVARLKGRRAPVKSALLDQRLIAGLGNIYVCEALYRARIAPFREAGTGKGEQARRLHSASVEGLNEAIAAGGSSLRDHAQVSGELGYFQHAFKVYGKAGELCQAPGCRGRITRVVQSGRSTFYCPRCQR
ncbi:MAG: bifunctional DNA-formamidopyrimidine glycosylase/DNA-(apurinic or apyrimidinic site) lyase [Alphaproteobacteria bacterium]|nr:bifunctional DNA-formamidopyrimidine glycosylase/DNA-(apurinic or apyrimidinic site) lyase [Alphaproteobacteria bacterium]